MQAPPLAVESQGGGDVLALLNDAIRRIAELEAERKSPKPPPASRGKPGRPAVNLDIASFREPAPAGNDVEGDLLRLETGASARSTEQETQDGTRPGRMAAALRPEGQETARDVPTKYGLNNQPILQPAGSYPIER